MGGPGATIRQAGYAGIWRHREKKGQQIFVDELTRFAARAADLRVRAIAERVAAPLRIAVRGRPGVGCRTVSAALDRAAGASGIAVTEVGQADVVVYVTAEVIKPEDRAALTGIRYPVVLLNKADLTGFATGDPVAAARARCAQLSAVIGLPMQPMIGLLAAAALDHSLCSALHELAAHPAGPACVDAGYAGFLAAQLPVPIEVRRRLLDTLDVFGIALGVAALRQGSTEAQVRALFRRVSGVDAVVARVGAAGAEVRYRRVLRAVAELEALAVSEPEVSEFLCHDDTVIARMAAAVDVVEAAGQELGPAAHLPRAIRWQRYSRGPVSEIQRACGADIARGSLRLWSRAGDSR